MELPSKAEGKKVAFIYTADKESNLLGKLLVDKYGRDNVVFLTHVGIRNDPAAENFLLSKIRYGIILLDGRININITKEDMKDVDGSYNRLFPTYYKKVAEHYKKPISEIKNDFDFIFTDRTRSELMLISALDIDTQDPVEHIKNNHYTIYDEFSDEYIRLYYQTRFESPDVAIMLSNFLDKPFAAMNNSDILRWAATHNYLDVVWQTSSCDDYTIGDDWTSNRHCGKCASCLNRKIQLKKAEIEDKTDYIN